MRLSVLLVGLAMGLSVVAAAFVPDTKCALCQKQIPAGKGVTAQVGKAAKHYRCIHCALTALQSKKTAFSIKAKTPLDHKSVTLTHNKGVWTQQPASTVFLILPERANECLDVHQPFASRDEFDRYLKKNPKIAAQKPKAYTIADYDKMLQAGSGK